MNVGIHGYYGFPQFILDSVKEWLDYKDEYKDNCIAWSLFPPNPNPGYPRLYSVPFLCYQVNGFARFLTLDCFLSTFPLSLSLSVSFWISPPPSSLFGKYNIKSRIWNYKLNAFDSLFFFLSETASPSRVNKALLSAPTKKEREKSTLHPIQILIERERERERGSWYFCSF